MNNTNEAGSAALKMESDSELVVQDCHFSGNNGSLSTIYVVEGNILTLSNSTFVNNTAAFGGGAIEIEVCVRRDITSSYCFVESTKENNSYHRGRQRV